MLFSYHTGYNETELYGNIHVGPGWRYTDKNGCEQEMFIFVVFDGRSGI
jgi:hypothetical protein